MTAADVESKCSQFGCMQQCWQFTRAHAKNIPLSSPRLHQLLSPALLLSSSPPVLQRLPVSHRSLPLPTTFISSSPPPVAPSFSYSLQLPPHTSSSTTALHASSTPTPLSPDAEMGVTKEVLKEGNGVKPNKGQRITVHCTGYTLEGMKKFWSTKDAGQQPFSFNVGKGEVIRGWDEGFIGMSQGEQARLTMTGDYAYGAAGFPAWKIGPNATLVFDVEILSVQ